MENNKPIHLNLIKDSILKALKHDFILPYDHPSFQTNENFKSRILDYRKNIAEAQDNNQIILQMETLRKDYLDTVWHEISPETYKNTNDGYKQSLEDLYWNSKIFNPNIAIQKISENIQNEEKSGVSKFLEKISTYYQKIKFTPQVNIEELSFEQLNNKTMPLNGKTGYSEVLLEASKISKKYNLRGIGTLDSSISNEEFSNFLTILDKGLENGSKALGITEDCMGFKGELSYKYSQPDPTYSGIYNSDGNHVSLVITEIEDFSSTVVHEWTHALDAKISLELKKSLIQDGFLELEHEKENFITEYKSRTFRLNDSQEAKNFELFNDFVSQSISVDPEALKRLQEDQKSTIIQGFWFHTLGKDYFSLPDEIIKTLQSEETYRLIRNKVIVPEDYINAGKISYLISVVTPHLHSEELEEKIISEERTSYSREAMKIIKKMDSYNQIGIKPEITSSFHKSDNAFNAIRKIQGLFSGKWRETKDLNYYTSDIEVIARYVESQTFNRLSSTRNEMNSSFKVYNPSIDSSFEDRRTKLFQSVFGKDSVKERDLSFNEKTFNKAEMVVNKINSVIIGVGFSTLNVIHHANKGAELTVNKSIDTFNKMIKTINKKIESYKKINEENIINIVKPENHKEKDHSEVNKNKHQSFKIK